MRKKIMATALVIVFSLSALEAFAAKRRVRRPRRADVPTFNQELHISGTIAPAFLSPAGIMLPAPYVEYFIIPNLALGFDFSYGYFEGSFWGIVLDFVNVKYVVRPSPRSRFSFFLKTGFGIAIGVNARTVQSVNFGIPVVQTSNAYNFDWVFSGGMNFWVNRMVGLTFASETHTQRGNWNLTVHMLRLGVTIALGF